MADPPADLEDSQELYEDPEEDSPYPCLHNVGEEITIKGRVVRITKDYVLERRRRYTCSHCRAIADGYSNYEEYYSSVIPTCPNRKKDCKGYMRLATKEPDNDDLMKYQEVMLQEIDSTESIPRIFKATLEGDLIDNCAPGEQVEIQGTVEMRSNPITSAKSKITIVIRCRDVRNLDGTRLNPDVKEMMRCAKEKWRDLVQENGELVARDLLLRCSFPNIKGLDYLKLACLMLMTGGPVGIKTVLDHLIRCQSHMLLVGDPGTAKSQLLHWVAKYISPSLYTNAFGCTSAGLTAAAVKTGSHWTLQAGVLVLCDGGVCCIDEWNQLKPVDQASCHEAMEQQTVSIAKAGIATRLRTRCSIVSATNPKKNVGCNEITTAVIGLSTSLISRFDLIMAVRDERDPEWDSILADFLLSRRDTPKEGEVIEEELFTELDIRAHLMVARNIRPEFDRSVYELVTAYYRFCRNDEFRDVARTTIRLQESIIRLSSAHARLCCKRRVTVVDGVVAIMMIESSVGFGRLLRPLNLMKEDELPLEPSRNMILEVLRALKVSEEFFNEQEHYNVHVFESQDEEEVVEEEMQPRRKKRKLNEEGKSKSDQVGVDNSVKQSKSPVVVIEDSQQVTVTVAEASSSNASGLMPGGVINQGEKIRKLNDKVSVDQVGDDNSVKISDEVVFIEDSQQLNAKEIVIAEGSSSVTTNVVLIQEKKKQDQSDILAEEKRSKRVAEDVKELNNWWKNRNEAPKVAKEILLPVIQEVEKIDVVADNENTEEKDQEDILNIDHSSLDSLILKMAEQETQEPDSVDIREDIEMVDLEQDKPSDVDEDEDDVVGVGLSQISLHSLMKRMKTTEGDTNLFCASLEPLRDPEGDWESLQNRLNDFNSQKEQIEEQQTDAEEPETKPSSLVFLNSQLQAPICIDDDWDIIQKKIIEEAPEEHQKIQDKLKEAESKLSEMEFVARKNVSKSEPHAGPSQRKPPTQERSILQSILLPDTAIASPNEQWDTLQIQLAEELSNSEWSKSTRIALTQRKDQSQDKAPSNDKVSLITKLLTQDDSETPKKENSIKGLFAKGQIKNKSSIKALTANKQSQNKTEKITLNQSQEVIEISSTPTNVAGCQKSTTRDPIAPQSMKSFDLEDDEDDITFANFMKTADFSVLKKRNFRQELMKINHNN